MTGCQNLSVVVCFVFLKGEGGGVLIVSGVENYQTFKLGSEGVKPKK